MSDTNKNYHKRKKICIEIAILLIVIIVAFIISMLIVINKKPQENLVNSENISNEDNSSNSISNGINKITAINYDSDIENPTTYIVVEAEKIEKIAKLLTNANWENCKYTKGTVGIKTMTDRDHYSWYIKIEGNTEAEIFMYGVPVVKVKVNGQEEVYKIGEIEYKEILAAFNIRYYLHKSDLEKPEKSKILELREKIFKDLTSEEILELQELTRWTHVHMEMQLLESVNIIKDSKSPYWNQSNYGGIFTDPLTGVGTDKIDCFNMKLQKLKKIKDIIKDEEIRKEFENIIELLQKSMDNHDLAGCFKVHEFIHDYDYFAINYPAYFEDVPPPDWEGINVYFGHLKLN